MATLNVGTVAFSIVADLTKLSSNMSSAARMVQDLSKVQESATKTSSMMGKGLTEAEGKANRFTGALSAARTTTQNLSQSINRATSHVTAFASTMASQAASFALGNVAYAALGKVVSGVGEIFSGMNSTLETTTLQFQSLGLSSTDAKSHVQDLFKFAKDTPFETEPVIQASRQLRVFGGASLDTVDNLRLLGDTAAATNAPLDALTFWIGRLYSAASSGRPFGEALQNLQQLGVFAPDTINKLEGMSQGGAKLSDVWKVVTGDLSRFNGSMAAQAGTWQGLTSTISDAVKIVGSSVLRPFFLDAEGGLKRLADFLSGPDIAAGAVAFGQRLETGFEQARAGVQHFWDSFGGTITAVVGGLLDVVHSIPVFVGGFTSMLPSFGTASERASSFRDVLRDVRGMLEFVASNARTIGQVLAVVLPVWLALNAVVAISNGVMAAHAAVVGIVTAAKTAASVATGVWTAAQWLLNLALTANPIGLVVVAIAALIAIVVLAVTHWNLVTATLQRAWQWLQSVAASNWAVQAALVAVLGPAAILIGHFGQVRDAAQAAWSMLSSFAGWLGSVLGPVVAGIGDVLGRVGGALRSFRDAASSIPGVAGALGAIGVPGFASGGLVPGPIDAPMLAVVHGGEYVVPSDRVRTALSTGYDLGGGTGGFGTADVAGIRDDLGRLHRMLQRKFLGTINVTSNEYSRTDFARFAQDIMREASKAAFGSVA